MRYLVLLPLLPILAVNYALNASSPNAPDLSRENVWNLSGSMRSFGDDVSQTRLDETVRPKKRSVSSRQSIDLLGTTWKLYTTEGRLNEWGTYTFLSEGKIQEDEKARWKLAGNKLTITEEYGYIEIVVKGNLMTGSGQLGMNPRPFRIRGNKIQENAVSSVSPGKSSLGNWPDLDNWTELDRGQKKGVLQFSQGGTLLLAGLPVASIRFKSTVDKIAVSPPAGRGKYAICVAFDQAASVGFLIHLDGHSGKRLALEGPPSVWAAWSPSKKHAVMASYYEGDPMLYSISLPSGNVRRFSLNVARRTEEENYDLDNLTWVDNSVFHLRVSINCNPYTDDNCSGQDRTKVLREYEVRVNVVTMAVTSERIGDRPAPLKPVKPESSEGGTDPTQPVGDFFTIQTPYGNIRVRNFYPSASIVGEHSVLIQDADTFQLVYSRFYENSRLDEKFFITIRGENRDEIVRNRRNAESVFLKTLGISKSDACKLMVRENISGAGELEFRQTRELPLSFCTSQ